MRDRHFYCFQGLDIDAGGNYIDYGIWLSHKGTDDAKVLNDIEDHCIAMVRNRGISLQYFGMTAFNKLEPTN